MQKNKFLIDCSATVQMKIDSVFVDMTKGVASYFECLCL